MNGCGASRRDSYQRSPKYVRRSALRRRYLRACASLLSEVLIVKNTSSVACSTRATPRARSPSAWSCRLLAHVVNDDVSRLSRSETSFPFGGMPRLPMGSSLERGQVVRLVAWCRRAERDACDELTARCQPCERFAKTARNCGRLACRLLVRYLLHGSSTFQPRAIKFAPIGPLRFSALKSTRLRPRRRLAGRSDAPPSRGRRAPGHPDRSVTSVPRPRHSCRYPGRSSATSEPSARVHSAPQSRGR